MNKPVLLLVDDEERIVRSLSMLFRLHYDVRGTTDARKALEIIRAERVHVVVSDQRMPIMPGAELLREVRRLSPSTMRILLTGYSEYDAVVASVNEGEVFRFLQKPWDSNALRATVKQAAEISAALFESPAGQPSVVAPASEDALGVLVIDTDAATYAAVQNAVSDGRPTYWAKSLDEGLEVLTLHSVAVVISELVLNGQRTDTALKLLKREHPEVVTLVVTPFRDVGSLVELINQGQIYRFLPKPVRSGPMSMSITSALRHQEKLALLPGVRAAHAVEAATHDNDPHLAARVMGYLSRIRKRAAAR
jgi:DNA-binding NtrC family response regulator